MYARIETDEVSSTADLTLVKDLKVGDLLVSSDGTKLAETRLRRTATNKLRIPHRSTPRIEQGNTKEGWIHIDQGILLEITPVVQVIQGKQEPYLTLRVKPFRVFLLPIPWARRRVIDGCQRDADGKYHDGASEDQPLPLCRILLGSQNANVSFAGALLRSEKRTFHLRRQLPGRRGAAAQSETCLCMNYNPVNYVDPTLYELVAGR